jgi:hypothetical protein
MSGALANLLFAAGLIKEIIWVVTGICSLIELPLRRSVCLSYLCSAFSTPFDFLSFCISGARRPGIDCSLMFADK